MATLELETVPIAHNAVDHHADHDAVVEPRNLERRVIVRLPGVGFP